MKLMFFSMNRPIWNVRLLPTAASGVSWAEDQGLVPKFKKCGRHRSEMTFFADSGFGRFRCSKCKKTVSKASGTLFEKAHLKPDQVAMIIYGFAHDWSHEDCQRESVDLTLTADDQTAFGSDTISAW